ncbi:MAG: ATP-binding cassette domain-containing protein [Alphaproteobacteria bacterium]|nr:ATP-binding cassette domain-containing protein [Alphaproteobacteria bacterium]
MNKTNTKIQIKNLHKAFNGKAVLSGINLSVAKGESLVIIGPSGTGKSVLIKNILGLIKPDQGKIYIDSIETTHLSESERQPFYTQMGMLFQGGALFDSLSVWENISFGLMESQKMPEDVAREEAISLLKAVGLSSKIADHSPADLSGGMQKRVSLARAVATKPKIMFFDEPTTGLDPIMAETINHLIIDNVKKLGATAVTITHDIHSASMIADRIAMLYDGKIVWEGTKAEFEKTKDPYILQMKNRSSKGPIGN